MHGRAVILTSGAGSLAWLALTFAVTAAAVTRDVTEAEGSGLADPLNLIETEATEDDLGDVVIIADEPGQEIKEENIFKCHKCLKNQFRYRHDSFCGKCVTQDIIDVHEQEKLNNAVRCKKCQKIKFRSRNALFCSAGCETKVEEPKTTTKPTATEKYKTLLDLERNEEKDEMKKERKKGKKQEEREKRRKEKQQRKLEKKRKKFGYNTSFSQAVWNNVPTVGNNPAKDPTKPELDVFGEILKALVVANTWQ